MARKRRMETSSHPEYNDHYEKSDDWVNRRFWDMQTNDRVYKASSGLQARFPVQLHRMLETVDGTNLSLIVRWLPHGRAFVILNRAKFVNEVLPIYFPSQMSFSSFRRQLSVYGFIRLSQYEDGYYHELLLRSRRTMAMLIPRPSRGQRSPRKCLDPTTEPDFYNMPWLPDVRRQVREVKVIVVTADTNDASSNNENNHTVHQPIRCSVPSSSRLPRPTARVRSETSGIHGLTFDCLQTSYLSNKSLSSLLPSCHPSPGNATKPDIFPAAVTNAYLKDRVEIPQGDNSRRDSHPNTMKFHPKSIEIQNAPSTGQDAAVMEDDETDTCSEVTQDTMEWAEFVRDLTLRLSMRIKLPVRKTGTSNIASYC